MINAFKKFFAMFYSLFSAGENLAQALEEVSLIAKEGTSNWAEEMRIEQEARLKLLRANATSRAKQALKDEQAESKPRTTRKKTTLKAAA